MLSKRERLSGETDLLSYRLAQVRYQKIASSMVHYIALFQLKKGVTEEEIEEMIRISRSCLHRMNEAHNFRSGRSIKPENEFEFFISADFESTDKLAMFLEDPNYRKFSTLVVEEKTTSQREFLYETEPGKNPKYS